MASIHKDPRFKNGPWYAAYTLVSGQRVFRSTKTRNKAQARIIADAWQEAETEAGRGDLTRERVSAILNETLIRLGQAPVEQMSVRKWLEHWLASKKPSVKQGSTTNYSQVIREFLDYLGERGAARKLQSISEIDIQGFLEGVHESGRSATTVNKMRTYLSIAFNQAFKVGRIPYNPVKATSRYKSDSVTKDTFSGGQIMALLRGANRDWQGAILFGYTTGARLGDTANLKWSNLDLENGIITYQDQKNGKSITTGLHPDFSDWLSEQPVPDQPDAPVFPSLAGKKVESTAGLSMTFIKLIVEAGIPNRLLRTGDSSKGRKVRALTFHSFRHTAATQVFNRAALKEITRRVTNHAAKGVVDRYIHEDLEAIREAVNLIPRLPK